MSFEKYDDIFRIILLTLVILTVLNFSIINSHSSDSEMTSSVSLIFLSSWAVPPNTQGCGIINITIFFTTPSFEAKPFALKLVISFPEGVYNSSGGSYIINYFPISYQTYISYNFNVIINSSFHLGSKLNFQGTLTWFLSLSNGSILQQVTPIKFSLPYFGEIGVKVISNTSFIHIGLNDVSITIVNEGKSPMKNVHLYADGQTIYIPIILSDYTLNLPILISPDHQFQYKLPIFLTYYTPYNALEHYNTTLNFIVLYNTSSSLLKYYNLLSSNPYYLEPGPNYLILYLNDSLGIPFNSSWLLISKDNNIINSFFIQNWRSGRVIKIFLPINITNSTTNLVRLNIILLTNNRTTYNLYSFSIPVLNSPRLSFHIISKNNVTYLEIINNLDITINNVDITLKDLDNNLEYNYTVSKIGAKSSFLLKLYNTVSESKEYLVYVKFRAYKFIITECSGINTNTANLILANYNIFLYNNQNMIYLLIEIKNIGKEPAIDSYLLLYSNSPPGYVSPIALHLGTVKPGEIVFESVGIYLGNPLPKTLGICLEFVYNNSVNYNEQNYTIQIPINTLYHRDNPFLFYVMSPFEYNIDGIPLIFIVIMIVLVIVILFPRIKK